MCLFSYKTSSEKHRERCIPNTRAGSRAGFEIAGPAGGTQPSLPGTRAARLVSSSRYRAAPLLSFVPLALMSLVFINGALAGQAENRRGGGGRTPRGSRSTQRCPWPPTCRFHRQMTRLALIHGCKRRLAVPPPYSASGTSKLATQPSLPFCKHRTWLGGAGPSCQAAGLVAVSGRSAFQAPSVTFVSELRSTGTQRIHHRISTQRRCHSKVLANPLARLSVRLSPRGQTWCWSRRVRPPQHQARLRRPACGPLSPARWVGTSHVHREL